MPSNVSKGKILKRFDAFCNDPDANGSGKSGAEVMLEFYDDPTVPDPHINERLKVAQKSW